MNLFDEIRKWNEYGNEYWNARELLQILGYKSYKNFKSVINLSLDACLNSGRAADEHFAILYPGKQWEDYQLSRYACYLVVINANSRLKTVAKAKEYFAIHARIGESVGADELDENGKRIKFRNELKSQHQQLHSAASRDGQLKPEDFAIFYDHGYKGLYGGLTAQDIAYRKGLSEGQNISDHMNSDELATNIFRASLAKQRLEKEKPGNPSGANRIHYEVGSTVRGLLESQGLTMPEDQPTPKWSIAQLLGKKKKKLLQGPQMEMFEDEEV